MCGGQPRTAIILISGENGRFEIARLKRGVGAIESLEKICRGWIGEIQKTVDGVVGSQRHPIMEIGRGCNGVIAADNSDELELRPVVADEGRNNRSEERRVGKE